MKRTVDTARRWRWRCGGGGHDSGHGDGEGGALAAAAGRSSQRRAELTAALRFPGGLQVVGGQVVIAAELDSAAVAARLRREIGAVYGCASQVSALPGRGGGPGYLLQVTAHAQALARRTGLIDHRGRPVRGMPPAVVAGSIEDAAAAWRGAFLARGLLPGPGRAAPSLEVACPSPEAAMALVGTARRLGVPAKTRQTRDGDRVVVRDDDAITLLLTRMGAAGSITAWRDRWTRRSVPAAASQPANLDHANARRAGLAAAATTARVARALQILSMEMLAADIPDHLLAAGRLRLQYPQDSLEQLGQRADPPLTKDAIAGRIRRLLITADTLARTLGVPDTEAALIGDAHRPEHDS